MKRRRDARLKAKFFARNGGLILKQQMTSEDSDVEGIRIFTSDELERATDGYNHDRILGQGGQATVYKGMLSDGNVIAINKSRIADESQLNVFINEVPVLWHINHRNVVKLPRCCLETEVALLVYEFVPNGTLSQHIHDPDEDFPITREMRLQIATDTSYALASLHSSSWIPVFHRDKIFQHPFGQQAWSKIIRFWDIKIRGYRPNSYNNLCDRNIWLCGSRVLLVKPLYRQE